MSKKKIWISLGVVILILLAFLLLSKKEDKNLIKSSMTVELKAVAGEPIKWQKVIKASTVANGQHLLKLPKTASNINISLLKNSNNIDKNTKTELSVADRKALSARSRLVAMSLSSQQLSEENKKSKNSGAVASLVRSYSSSIGSLMASAGDALGGVTDSSPTMTVDITPVVSGSEESITINSQPSSESDSSSQTTTDSDTSSDDISESTTSDSTSASTIVSLPSDTTTTDTTAVNTTSSTETENQPSETVTPSSPTSSSDSTSTSASDSSATTADSSTSSSGTDGTEASSSTNNSSASPSSSTNTSTSSTTENTQTQTQTQNTNTENTVESSETNATSPTTENTSETTPVTTADVIVEYETPAPVIAETTTDTGKVVSVSENGASKLDSEITNVLAFTNIPEIYKVGQENKIKIKWLNENGQEMPFQAYDLDNNGKLDYIEWTVPHLSTQTFEIIFISKALELDANKETIGDIYDLVQSQDGDWASIPDGHFVKVTFEKFLVSDNDISIFARSASSSTIEVYNADTGLLVANFPIITEAKIYRVELTSLGESSSNVFDLKIIGDVDINYIVDPSPVTVTDSFSDSSKVASTLDVTVNTTDGQVVLSATSSWTCGTAIVDPRDGKIYNTVLIGSQCWMQQNLNVGTMVLGTATQGSSCSAIEKYCYSDTESNCGTYGGLYQWNQAMCGSTTARAKGICPTGWHIPTHDEFTTLERTTCTSGTCVSDFPYDTSTTGWRGTNEGTTLRSTTGLFRGLLAGTRDTSATFVGLGSSSYFWSSVESGGRAWYRYLNSGYATVTRSTFTKTLGFSVRCLKD